MKFRICLMALLTLGGLAAADHVNYRSSVRLQGRPDVQTIQGLTRISLVQAAQTAQKAAPRSKLLEVELDNEDGNVVYKVKLLDGPNIRKMVIDAGNAAVLANRLDYH